MTATPVITASFFDTSALVRRYDNAEPGADRVRALCRQGGDNAVVIAHITSVEVAAALNRKVRERILTVVADQDRLWRLFRFHRLRQYRMISADEHVFRRAEELVFGHPLRADDAVQLATALRAAELFAGLAECRFYTADRTQAQAAAREGLQVELIA